MKTKSILYSLVLLASVSVLAQCTGSSGKASSDEAVASGARVRQFSTVTVSPDTVARALSLTGRVVPLQKISVIAQVQGTAQATSQSFEEGVTFRKGQTLIAIDDDDFRYELSAQKSELLTALTRVMSDIKLDYADHFATWNAYLASIKIDERIPELPEVADQQLRYFLAANNIFNLYYRLKSQEEKLGNFRLYAPFDGAVTVAQVDPGDLVMPGTKLGEFIRTDVYEVKAAVSASDLSKISEGQAVTLRARSTDETYTATVHRLGKSVDPSTQSVSVYLRARGDNLREGMYLEGELSSEYYPDAVRLDKEVITRENQVYTIQDSVVRLKEVNPVHYLSDAVIVQGLEEGDQVITESVNSPLVGTRAVAQ